jgi:hypothetical protein
VLEAVAGPAAEEQAFRQRGWRSMRKSPFELFSYWHTRASTIGRSARAGNRFFM